MMDKIAFRKKQRLVPNRSMSAAGLAFLLAFAAILVLAMLKLPRSDSRAVVMEGRPASATSSNEAVSRSRRNAIVAAANKVGPAVVNIGVVTTRIVRGLNPLYDDYFDFFFRDFFPRRRYYKYRETIPSIGSGVLVSPDGYVITNEHVVHGAEEITVITPDGLELSGTLAGIHEPSDIAIIRVEGDGLPYAALGDSDNLLIGEWAIAIGNPFGRLLEDAHPSVTVGVVSARKRSFKPGGSGRVYTDMIQTDAAINPGNSGGPLVNADGEVIGINTFIFTRSGGSLGVGFAIPINRVKKILDEVKEHGKVREPWLGFTLITVDEETARALGLPAGGVVVRSVEINSPADEAGLKPGDVIASVDQRIVNDADDAMSAFGSALVGEQFSVGVLRKRQELSLTLTAKEAR